MSKANNWSQKKEVGSCGRTDEAKTDSLLREQTFYLHRGKGFHQRSPRSKRGSGSKKTADGTGASNPSVSKGAVTTKLYDKQAVVH